MKTFGYDGDGGSSVVCLGCGERIRYMDLVSHTGDGYLHEGCEENYMQNLVEELAASIALTAEDREALVHIRYLVQRRYDDERERFAPNLPDARILRGLAVLDKLIAKETNG